MYGESTGTTSRVDPAPPFDAGGGVEHLLVFARYPQVGGTKTRLIPAVGAESATAIYVALATHTLQTAQAFCQRRRCQLTICFAGGDQAAMASRFGQQFRYVPQQGDGLGPRLVYATQQAFSEGADRVVVIGTDCHELTAHHLEQAFEAVKRNDVVIGPATDGGYTLIGLSHFQPIIFDGITWSSEHVLAQTRQRIRLAGKSCVQIATLSDVDEPPDLIGLRGAVPDKGFGVCFAPPTKNRISVVIPTLNEASQLPDTLAALGTPSAALEAIVVDGGSTDATLAIAKHWGCRTLQVTGGRARQMNAGAAIASGATLLFLHADTRVPSDYAVIIERALAGDCVAGAFRLSIEGRDTGLRVVEWGANQRARWLQMPYGDQAIFIRANTFYQHGGYALFPIMEDYELMSRLRRVGKIQIVRESVRTSSRRWRQRGVIRTTLINQACLAAYHLGISPRRIAAFYRHPRR